MLPLKRPSTYLEAKPGKRRRSESLSQSDDDASDRSSPGPRPLTINLSVPSQRIAKELDLDEDEVEDDVEDDDAYVNGSSSTIQAPSTSRLGMKPNIISPERLEPVKDPSTETTSRIPPSKKPKISDFSALGVSATLVSSLGSMSIRRPTPVQAACIPELLAG